MPSPFPGMNPYLENPEVRHDFHESFMPRMRDLIVAQVGPNYTVKIDEHIYVHEPHDSEQRKWQGRADVSVAEHFAHSAGGDANAAILEAPAEVVPLLIGDERESFVEIRDRRNRMLVTVIELLSPANKVGGDRDQFISKRHQVLKSQANLVEIDLLRGGQRMPFEDLPPCDYYVMVSRTAEPKAGCWPIMLRDRLPVIPVPLKLGDADVRIDLQQLVHDIHDAAGYANYIYEYDIVPPLKAADAVWVADFVANLHPPR